MDIRMPELNGLDATKQLIEQATWPVKVLILTTFSSDEYVYQALRAGASGFVLKDIPPEELVSAVRTIANGGALLAPVVTKRLIGEFTQKLQVNTEYKNRLSELTGREKEVLTAIAKGLSNSDIADELIIGTTTVKTHVSSLLSKLGLRDRVQVVVFAYESGLVQAGEKR